MSYRFDNDHSGNEIRHIIGKLIAYKNSYLPKIMKIFNAIKLYLAVISISKMLLACNELTYKELQQHSKACFDVQDVPGLSRLRHYPFAQLKSVCQ
jgi:hypothetical protein